MDPPSRADKHLQVDNKTKRSRVECLKNKNEVSLLVLFKRYIGEFEHGDSKCIRIRVDNDSKYMEEVFKVWRKKREIRTKLIVADSLEINNCIEYLNQTLMQKINTIIKIVDLVVNFWSKIIQTINLYCNIVFVIERSIISFEANIEYFYNYNYIQRIDQQEEVVKIQLNISW